MESWKYLIVGGGLAADAAVRGIRESDRSGSILVVSDEAEPPYDRPLLSRALWKETPVDAIWRNTETAGAALRPPAVPGGPPWTGRMPHRKARRQKHLIN